LARAGAGSVRDMLSVADTCVSYSTGKLTYADVNAVLGNADFSSVATLCKAVIDGDAGLAFEKTEGFLSAGKSVGMLLKDILNVLNACAVAKTCRDGKSILALPDTLYDEIAKIAKSADGHRLLRVTEIFAGIEADLKYSASPRILFETAVLKASMPQEDYDIEGLLARISALEEKLKNGVVVQNAGGMVEVNVPVTVTETPVSKAKEQPKAEEVFEEDYSSYDVPPDEAETGGSAYFDAPIRPTYEVKKTQPILEQPAQPAPQPAQPKAVMGDAKTVFGAFLRNLRKTAKNGVLVTMCMDLDYSYEEGVLVLSTQSDTVYRSL
jgi:DNA polymerase III gamma/tau subunit